jgi:hypothetical protein
MGTGSFAALTSALLLVCAASAAAQKQPPIPPPPAPAALSVPNPLAAMTPGPRDLYRSPDGSDRFQHQAPYPAIPPVLYFPGPLLMWPFYAAYGGAVEYRPALDAFNRRSMAAAIGQGALVPESVPANVRCTSMGSRRPRREYARRSRSAARIAGTACPGAKRMRST